MLCVITDYMGDDTETEVTLLESHGIESFVSPSTDPSEWLPVAIQADAILTRHAPLRADVLADLQRCRIIARYGTGYDNIDIEAAKAQGIVVTAVVDYATPEVADHTLSLILSLARAIPSFGQSMRQGGWTPTPLPTVSRLEGKVLGLFGCGRIGAAVARRASGFGIEVLAFDPYATSVTAGTTRVTEFDELLSRSDILSLHAPLTAETKGVISRDAIARLPRGAIVINVARGGLLDLNAAVEAIQTGQLGGLGVDVTPVEPLPDDHPARSHPHIIVTPHVGYYSIESVAEAKRRSVTEIIRVLEGQPPLNPVFDLADTQPILEAP